MSRYRNSVSESACLFVGVIVYFDSFASYKVQSNVRVRKLRNIFDFVRLLRAALWVLEYIDRLRCEGI